MHLFKSLWITHKLDVLSKGICHEREECREDFKNMKSTFPKGDSIELELPFFCSWGVCCLGRQLLLFCHVIQGLRGSTKGHLLGPNAWEKIKICAPFASVLTA